VITELIFFWLCAADGSLLAEVEMPFIPSVGHEVEVVRTGKVYVVDAVRWHSDGPSCNATVTAHERVP